MVDHGEDVPAYRKIRVVAQDAPAAAIADVEAWQARERYPELRSGGGPRFGVVREREEGGWEVLAFGEDTPQGARDAMAATFRRRTSQGARADDTAAVREEYLRAVELLDWEVVDELTVDGSRYRVVRAEPFIRMGPTGPEPPRPSDPDPAAVGHAHEVRDPTKGFVIDAFTESGMSEGILRMEMLALVRKPGTVPEDVRRDSRRAMETHPGGVLLPAVFMSAEYQENHWRPGFGASSTPQGARDNLATYLRVSGPVLEELDADRRAAYARAADVLDDERCDEVDVAGCPTRVVRVERLVRIGPDGPEGPRPSDHDPEPPPAAHLQQLRADGLLEDDEEDELSPVQARELLRLGELEQQRRKDKGVD